MPGRVGVGEQDFYRYTAKSFPTGPICLPLLGYELRMDEFTVLHGLTPIEYRPPLRGSNYEANRHHSAGTDCDRDCSLCEVYVDGCVLHMCLGKVVSSNTDDPRDMGPSLYVC